MPPTIGAIVDSMAKLATKRRDRGLAIEWPTVGLAIGCHIAWLVLGLLVWPSYPIIALIALGVVLAFQSSLMHEVLHGHPTRNARINEAFVFLPLGLTWPFRRFKALHLRHHADERLTDPFDDPESYYRALWQHAQLPPLLQTLLNVNNTMVGRVVLGPWLSTVGFFIGDAKLMLPASKMCCFNAAYWRQRSRTAGKGIRAQAQQRLGRQILLDRDSRNRREAHRRHQHACSVEQQQGGAPAREAYPPRGLEGGQQAAEPATHAGIHAAEWHAACPRARRPQPVAAARRAAANPSCMGLRCPP